nr:reverse transcriptase [Chrysogorgia stellata]
MLDDINKEESRLDLLTQSLKVAMLNAKNVLSKFDFVRFCSYLADIHSKKILLQCSERTELISRLKKSRYGAFCSDSIQHIKNLSSYTLSSIEKEVLSKGLNFAIPQSKIKRETIFSEFEILWSQLENLTADNEEVFAACKARVSDIAHAYSGSPIECKESCLAREHLIALANLRKNRDIVICKPDKGTGVVILDKTDYNSKMLDILKDNYKFRKMGELPHYDKTNTIERNLQSLLLSLKKSGQIDEDFYKEVRPTGAERPRMYGLPKVHKDGVPLRPILSMIKSSQHSLAKKLSLLLNPVLNKYSSHILKDSFTFVNDLKQLNYNSSELTMCSFDVVSLFTNIPLEETIKICIDTLYHSDIKPPNVSEDAFHELMFIATKGVEFSFGEAVYKQIDGVAMGSPLGPVLANIFVGYYESKMFDTNTDIIPIWYKRYVDDTFTLFNNKETALSFLHILNTLHPSLKFTHEFEKNNKLAFLDVLVHKEDNCFLTSIYRKSTFTGLYTRFDSFSSTKQKISLVKCLIDRTRKLSSDKFLEQDLCELKMIFLANGYPGRLLDKIFMSRPILERLYGPNKCPVYLKLPWIGKISEHFEKQLKVAIENTFLCSQLRCIFSTRTILPPTPKEVLPAFSSSSIIYEFKCECGSRYVGRTSQRLGDIMKQHVPTNIRRKIVPLRQQPRRQCRQDTVINCDSAISRHLLSNSQCAKSYNDTNFRILAKCRSPFQLKVLESIYIKLSDPDLCRQKEFIFKTSLF